MVQLNRPFTALSDDKGSRIFNPFPKKYSKSVHLSLGCVTGNNNAQARREEGEDEVISFVTPEFSCLHPKISSPLPYVCNNVVIVCKLYSSDAT